MNSPSRKMRQEAIDRLADTAIGFNVYHAEASDGLSVDPVAIDFAGHSANFFQAQFDPRTAQKTIQLAYPVMCIYVQGGSNDGDRAVSASFDGVVNLVIDVFLSWNQPADIINFEDAGDAVEQAMFNTFDVQARPLPHVLGIRSYKRVLYPPVAQDGNQILHISFGLSASVIE